jgi:hypothetical protein
MTRTWTSEKLPQFEPAIRQLTEQHLKLEDEPLHLALTYLPSRNGREVYQGAFLFEVIGGAADQFSQRQDLFEVSFDAVPGLSTGFDQTLHLILTTPRELKRGLTEGWPLAIEVTDAVRRDDYKVLYGDTVGRKVLRQIRAAARSHKRAPRG